MTGRIIKKWMSLLLAVTMLISMVSLNVSASETDKTYKAYDASRHRKVISQNGTTDSEWSLCMTSTKQSPGTSTEATGEYSKNENATKDTYTRNSGKGDFQKIKRMLFYKLKHPELNYQVLQNEYYYQQGDEANKRQYDTNYSLNPQLNKKKQDLRAFAEDSSHDDEINSKMEVFIYSAKNQLMQNLISAKLKELPPPPPSTPPTKVKFSKKALTENGEELKGATIRLTKEDGSLVEEWVTDGTVKEFELKDGKYTFTEISAPAKYQVATAITFEVKNGKAIVKGIEVTGNTIVMVDKLKELPPPPPSTPPTKVKFSKKALTENGEELKGATIRLTKEDGSLVEEWVTDGTVKEFELKDGKYTFTEISAPAKYQVATAITFEVKNGKAIVKGIEVTGNTIVMVDKLKELPPPPPSTPPTKVKFSKKALTENGEELKGATIRLTKEDGSLVEEWVTDGTVKEFELKDGKYTFTEISAPAKYQVATAITFEVKNGKAIVKGIEVTGNTIVMVDKLKELPPPPPSTPPTKVKFSKKALTENGEELKGATIRLTKEDGSLVEEWVTDGTVKEFELKDGKYTFTEISAPAKYQVATAITFEVKNGKAIVKGIEVTGNTIVMVDKLKELPPPPPSTPPTKVKFSKKALTENGEELKGATIRLTKEDGSLVEEWVTDGTVKEFELKDGKYTFTEISAPAKYQVATAITFEVKNGKAIVKGIEVTGNTIVMVDKLKELPPPPPSTPPTKVKFSKKALTENGEELKGATIRLTKEDGSLVEEWVTDGTVKEFELKDGKYTFTEISAPAKYQVATAITFEVKNGKAIVKGIEVTGNTIVMVDKLKELPPPPPSTPPTKVKFSKKALTENGEELKGATIRLTKEDGSLVEEWVTDGTVKEFELKDGKYTFTEISAPAKYQVATAITFEVKNGKAIVKGIEVTGNTIVMVDKLKELPPPNTNKTLPKTGEGTNISLYAWLMLTSGALLVLIGYRRRNHAK